MPPALLSRQEVVERLVTVVRRLGYDGASLAELSKATGLGKSSLYHYFPAGKDDMVRAVLEHLEQDMGAVSATVALRDGDADEIFVEAAVGSAWQRARRARYKVGEGITGRVVATGKPVVVPEVGRDVDVGAAHALSRPVQRAGTPGSSGRSELFYRRAQRRELAGRQPSSRRQHVELHGVLHQLVRPCRFQVPRLHQDE